MTHMLVSVSDKSKKLLRSLGIFLFVVIAQPVRAAGPPGPSAFNNPLAVSLMILMILLLIVIAILANILIGAADIRLKKTMKVSSKGAVATMLLVLLLTGSSSYAQTGAVAAEAPSDIIGGMAASTFYIMTTVIFLELSVILILLVNIRYLIKAERAKEAEVHEEARIVTIAEKKARLSWWDKFNKLRPVTQEAELDLGHEYDGIRELNNRLPPWWIYGFYATIIFAGIYLWRFHVSHTAPSAREEYETAVAKGEEQVQRYLKMKGDNVDENTVTLLADAADIEAGKAIFTNPANCAPCHRPDAGGNVGPNLTDDYWLYGGNIKDVFKTIKYGTTKGMRSWKDDLSAKQIAQVASYIKSLHGTNPANPKEKQGELYKDDMTSGPAVDSLKLPHDSLKTKENKVALN